MATDIGTFKHLPPVITLQYHFDNYAGYTPYLGAGLNYTQITQVNLLNGGANLNSHNWGGVLQAGVDFQIIDLASRLQILGIHAANDILRQIKT